VKISVELLHSVAHLHEPLLDGHLANALPDVAEVKGDRLIQTGGHMQAASQLQGKRIFKDGLLVSLMKVKCIKIISNWLYTSEFIFLRVN